MHPTDSPPGTPPRACIFDLDGTLVDSLPDIHEALSHALRAMKLPPVTREQTRGWIGDGLPALCRRAVPQLDKSALEMFMEYARTHYAAHVVDETRPFPNIMQMLDLLKAECVPCSVLTNKPHALAVESVRHLGLMPYFVDVVGYRSEEEKKPDPRAARRLAQSMGESPAYVALVGDSVADIRTARNAGMISVAVTWGYQNSDVLRAESPDFFLEDPLELPRRVQKK